MKYGEKFNTLSNALKENTSYKLNANGIELIKNYHSIITEIEKVLIPILEKITKNPIDVSKQSAIGILSTINSTKKGNEIFDIMARLDVLTNNGKTIISGDKITFNMNDKILQYLEKA